jgi:lysophospholipase L1-like esterase
MKKISFLFSLTILLVMFAGCKTDNKNSQAGMFPRGEPDHLDRFEQEIQQFEAADKTAMPPKGSVLFVGSSSIRLWSTLEKDFAPLPVINRGFGGSTIPEVIYYANRIVYKYQPGVVVFYCGENDIAENQAPPVVFQNFKKFIGETEKNLPNTPVIFISAKPSPSRWNLWREMQQFNSMVEKFAENRPSLRYVNITSSLMGLDGQPNSALFVEDKLHMNSQGYERWVKILKPVVQEMYAKEMAQ